MFVFKFILNFVLICFVPQLKTSVYADNGVEKK